MKLTFYGLWEDERPKLNELTQKYGFECVATNDVLSMDNAALCKGSAGVSVLGKRRRRGTFAHFTRIRNPVFVYAKYRI